MRLIYFTASYPFGLGEQWKANELNILRHHFAEIVVVPFSYAGNHDRPKPLPEGVILQGPLFHNENFLNGYFDLIKIIFNRNAGYFFKEFFAKKVYRKKQYFGSWRLGSLRAIALLENKLLQSILHDTKNDILYFYWGKGSCEILPFLDKKSYYKSFVRMHRYDLFEHANNGYIPFRASLLNSVTVIAPSSTAGKDHLDQLYPQFADKIQVFRCGTISDGKLSEPSVDGILRVVSCALLSPVKRIHLIIESLALTDFPIIWHHIGDGVLRNELKALVKKHRLESKFIFEGLMDSREVLEFYKTHQLDLFVNVSESEGVPFSIMEAFSVSIPVLATDVGGTCEIVDDKVGGLLPANLSPKVLADHLRKFSETSYEQKMLIRKSAFERYKTHCNAEKLVNELATFLRS